MKDEKITRRGFLKKAAVTGAAVSAAGAGTFAYALPAGAQPGAGQVHGVCFLGGQECQVTYVDLGPTNSGNTPVYVMPSDPNGPPNPFDSGGNYNPFRLQNNVFAGGGRKWPMWVVHSAGLDLMASTDGTILWGDGAAQDGRPTRDLTTNPITSEEELLALEAAGDVTLMFTGVIVDCPITKAKNNETVVNLNPDFPVCNRSQ